jgi:tripartite-type tricarboxylate transporter receptor subunit TctC
LIAAPLVLASLAARAQAQRTIRLAAPFPAGGATDGLAWLWAPELSGRIGLPVVVDNRPGGGGGAAAADAVAKAAPDGLTLLLATSSIASTGPAVNPMAEAADRLRGWLERPVG